MPSPRGPPPSHRERSRQANRRSRRLRTAMRHVSATRTVAYSATLLAPGRECKKQGHMVAECVWLRGVSGVRPGGIRWRLRYGDNAWAKRMGKEDVVRLLATRAAAVEGLRLAYLFGSWARGQERPTSDIDVGVLVDDDLVRDAEGVKRTLWRLIIALSGDGVPSDRRDLVFLNDAPPLLRHHVLRDGLLLHTCNKAERVRFAVRTMRDYQDIEPKLAQQRRWRVERIKRNAGKIAETVQDGGPRDILAAARRVGQIPGTGKGLGSGDRSGVRDDAKPA